jgi:hypothetical protein
VRKYGFVILVFFAAAIWITPKASAQVNHIITTIDHRFGETIHFQAEIESEFPVVAAVLYFQVEGETRTNMGLAKVIGLGNNRYQTVYTHMISNNPIPPFSTISAHWELFLIDGTVQKSPAVSYPYIDNRFKWDTFEKNGIQIHWYSKEKQFGELMDSIVTRGKSAIQEVLPGAKLKDLEIYIYSDEETLPSRLQDNTEDWVVGIARPESGVMMVVLPDVSEQQSLAEQRIPHELMHLQLFQDSMDGYRSLPVWLREGLASAVEIYSNPDYPLILKEASNNNKLEPIHSLCSAFPLDTHKVILSYAEAQSFVRYLRDTYGTAGIKSLIIWYPQVQDCEKGFKKAIGISLSQAELDWKRGLFKNDAQKSFEGLLPWMIILVIVLTAPIIGVIRMVFSRKKANP